MLGAHNAHEAAASSMARWHEYGNFCALKHCAREGDGSKPKQGKIKEVKNNLQQENYYGKSNLAKNNGKSLSCIEF